MASILKTGGIVGKYSNFIFFFMRKRTLTILLENLNVKRSFRLLDNITTFDKNKSWYKINIYIHIEIHVKIFLHVEKHYIVKFAGR